MAPTYDCDLCGTVNVSGTARCIACGNALASAAQTSGPPPEEELDSSAGRATVLEDIPGRLTGAKATTALVGDAPVPRTVTESNRPATAEVDGDEGLRFGTRLLLPDGDRRSVEIGRQRIALGSGLDQLGVTGDPRVGDAEAALYVENDQLYVDPAEGAAGVYRRLRDEERLREGDVILMGDVAAHFDRVDPGPPVDGARHVLGGSANTPCGRLTFLRRDGSAGPIHDLPAGKTIVGRTDGHLNFPQDARLSRRHVRFFASDKGVSVEDLGSRNGTYLRVRQKSQLDVGDALRIGSAGLQIRTKS